MAQFIKLTDSLILNADSIDIVVENGANSVIIVLAETSYDAAPTALRAII